MTVGNKICELRKIAGIPQETLAQELSVSIKTIEMWESGVLLPDINSIIDISAIFSVSTDYLLKESALNEELSACTNAIDQEMPSFGAARESNKGTQKDRPTHSRKGKRYCWVLILCIAVIFIFVGIFLHIYSNPVQKAAGSVLYLELYNSKGEVLGSGSGILIDETTIVTNYHVIDSVYKIIAKTSDGLQSTEVGSVFAYNEARDLAILKTSAPIQEKPLSLEDSDSVSQGDNVFAVGYPLGITNTLSDGVVSALYTEDGYDFIQITAPISSGSSGGALLNKKGKVIGVICASYVNGQNMNLAIPANDICRLLENSNEITLSELYEETLSGYAAYSESQMVDFEELCSNPLKYDGELVTTVGYVAMRSFPPGMSGTSPYEQTQIYVVPSIECLTQWEYMEGYITSFEFMTKCQKLYFSDFEVLKTLSCSGPLYSEPDSSDDSLKAEPGDCIAVTGMFHYREAEPNSNTNGSISSTDYSCAYMDLMNVSIIDDEN